MQRNSDRGKQKKRKKEKMQDRVVEVGVRLGDEKKSVGKHRSGAGKSNPLAMLDGRGEGGCGWQCDGG
jgi:ABC-type ATPase with predicted acetyltransferase domain